MAHSRQVYSLSELYSDPTLYSSPDMFSPPSERLDHVIRFELTQGCSWGRCTYCGGYDGIKYAVKSVKQYQAHVRQVWARIGDYSRLAYSLRRIFVGGGNALAVDIEEFAKLLKYTRDKFEEHTGDDPRRISSYGRTADILQYDSRAFRSLKNRGLLDLIYWGIESGSDEVLSYINKGCTHEEMVKAGQIINGTGIDLSVMIMPGLGGLKYYKRHAEATAALLKKLHPRYITFMGVNAAPHTAYAKKMAQEQESGENRPLTDKEMVLQMADIINKFRPVFDTKIGCFSTRVDTVGYNPVTFGSYHIYGDYERRQAVEYLQRNAKLLEV